MVETCVGPSELHLKKELTALRKSRFLQDPETSSSWRSPLSSRSVTAAAYNFKYGSEIKRNDASTNSGGMVDVSCNLNSVNNENRRKKVYLYNWGNHSRKSSDSGIKLDEDDRQESLQSFLEDNMGKPKRENSINADDPAVPFFGCEASPDTRVKRTSRKQRRKAISKHHSVRNSTLSKLLDLPSSSFAIPNSMEQYDDAECSNSEDLQQSVRGSNQKSGCASQVASPLFSVSGCGNWSDSSKILRHAKREESSYSNTPVSTSSYNRHGDQNTSTVGSWDGTVSLVGDEVDQMDLPGRQGCGIPCYSSQRRKDRGCGGWYSPSLSDTLRRKGGSILCGSQLANNRRRSLGVHKRRGLPKSSQGLPLLHNSCDQGRSSADTETDEASTNYGELDLEAISRLDGSRWPNCRGQEGHAAVSNAASEGLPNPRSLSQKYRPRSFEDIIGQNIVVQSLKNAIQRGRIAPAYIFQGPRGTGKTSMARIFSAALNCVSTEKAKPCGFCRECTDFATKSGSNMKEVVAINKKAIDRMKYTLKNLPAASSYSCYKVFVIDECHMLSSKTWSTFIKFLEDSPSRVVFIFITIDPDSMPRAVVSRCQRYIFPKVKDADVVNRLRKLSSKERLDVEQEALGLIAVNSNGSLRDAETMLEQLSLLGKRITSSLVFDLVGVVSDETLLDLLEIAMSSETAETVRKSRELLDSGIDPTRLMSQLAGLIMDIIAGTHQLAGSKSDSVFGGRRLTEAELDRLQQALKVLSDAEKQLRHSSERSTWFTAALLQLGSGATTESIHSSGNSSKHSVASLRLGVVDVGRETSGSKNSDASQKLQHAGLASLPRSMTGHASPLANTSSSVSMRQNPIFDSFSNSFTSGKVGDSSIETDKAMHPEKLKDIWRRCIQGCHSKTLRNLLSVYGKLVSLTEVDGSSVASIGFEDPGIKSRVERFLSSITNSMEILLRHSVEIRIELLSDGHLQEVSQKHSELLGLPNAEAAEEASKLSCLMHVQKQDIDIPRKSVDNSETLPQSSREQDETFQKGAVPAAFSSKQDEVSGSSDKVFEASINKEHGMASEEQRLESAWLQTAEKGTPGLVNSLKHERGEVLPRNGFTYQSTNHPDASWALAFNSKHREDELNHEIKALRVGGQPRLEGEMVGRANHFSISPSHLHSNMHQGIFDKESPVYESGSGCNGLLCWRCNRSQRKGKQVTRLKSKKSGRISCFGRGRSKMSAENKSRKRSA